jgi:hypothetical protein
MTRKAKPMSVVFLLIALGMLACAVTAKAQGPLTVEPDGKPGFKVHFWLESSLRRVYPRSEPGSAKPLDILAPRNGQVSFQACLRNDRPYELKPTCTVTGADDLKIQVRRVGYVMMEHGTTGTPPEDLEGASFIPGLVPDPLYPENSARVGPFENVSFWITVKVPADAKPGKRELVVHFDLAQTGPTGPTSLTTNVEVSQFVVKPRHDFPVIHWYRGEALWDWYKTGRYEDPRTWEISRNYLQNMVDHGTNVVTVPLLVARRETFQRPPQLLKVTEPSPGKYEFDFSDVSKFLKLSRECGFEYFEWSHFWIYWGAENPVRVYKFVDGKAVMLWPPTEDGHGPVFHNFMKQFLPQFHDFLIKEGVLDKSFFHISDEPGEGKHLENYGKARAFLNENAPWMKGTVMDALSDIEYGRQGLTDIPIPIISAAQPYIDEKIPHWVYFCCGPRGAYLQRLLDTPLPKIRMSGWLFYRLGADGFLHWGYNYWHLMEQEKLGDPFHDQCNGDWPGIPPGDPFEVYPGVDGKPIDSLRWEVWAESLQDYAILQTAGIKPTDPMLADIKSYADFPKNEKWIEDALEGILSDHP